MNLAVRSVELNDMSRCGRDDELSHTSPDTPDSHDTIALVDDESNDPDALDVISMSSLRIEETTAPVTFTWEDVSVICPAEKKKTCCGLRVTETPAKTILSEVSGVAKAGSVLAIMGASGSGKTMLLNVLTQRNLNGLDVSGQVRLNGHPAGDEVRRVAAYSQQQDAFIGLLKVREHLTFHAQLRLPSSFTKGQKQERVVSVMRELGLSHRAETLIGIPGKMKTLSGGERKRLSFATELLTNPNVMLCDEPTTGLDAFMAQNVVQTLRQLAERGRTVICTIHQPASEVFVMFDQLLLLSDGKTAFMGAAKDAIVFFGSCGLPCPVSYNPADFFIQTLAQTPGKEEQHEQIVKTVCGAYRKSTYFDDIQIDIDHLTDMAAEGKGTVNFGTLTSDSTLWEQLKLLTWRCWIAPFRNKTVFAAIVLQNICVALFFDIVYWRIEVNQQAIQNVSGFMLGTSLHVAFTIMFVIYNIIPQEKHVFRREVQNRMYAPALYYMAHTIAEFVPYTLQSVLFAVMLYWPTGLYPSAESAFIFIAAFAILSMYGGALGRLVSVAIDETNWALGALTLARNLISSFAGPFISILTIPWLLKPLAYLCASLYTEEILTANQWMNIDSIPCDTDGNSTTGRCVRTGSQALWTLNYNEDHIGRDFGIIIVMYIAVEMTGLLIHSWRSRKIR